MSIFTKANRDSFLMNFLAVVLGIVLTFGGEALISRNQEKKNLKNTLSLVSSELKENLSLLELGDTLVTLQREAGEFLTRYESDYTVAPKDSLYMYCNVPFSLVDITIYTDALELLKTSGVLTQLDDKELALGIFKAYGFLQDNMTFFKTYYEHRNRYMDAAMTKEVTAILSSDAPTAEQIWTEVVSTIEGRQFIREMSRMLTGYDCTATVEMVNEIIEQIENY